MNTTDAGRVGTYMGGFGVSAYASTGQAAADIHEQVPESITLLQVPLDVSLGVTVGDVCTLMGALAVLGRMILDWKRYIDKRRRENEPD